MPKYTWTCHACSAGNQAAAERCSSCGCPATATFAQISDAKAAAGIVEPTDGRTFAELVRGVADYATRRDSGGARTIGTTLVIECAFYLVVAVILLFLSAVSRYF